MSSVTQSTTPKVVTRKENEPWDIHEASSTISTALAIPLTIFMLLRILPIKNPRQKYLYYIIGQCVLDCFYSTSNCIRTYIGEGDTAELHLHFFSRILMVYSCLLSTLIALNWKQLFIQLGKGSRLYVTAWVAIIPCTLYDFLSYLYDLWRVYNDTVAYILTSSDIYIAIITTTFILESIIIPVCLYEVFKVPTNTLSQATYRGWRKVAMGLVLKMIMQLILIIYQIVSLFFYRMSRDTQAYLDSAITIALIIGMVYPGIDVYINTYMVSGLVFKRRSHRIVTVTPTTTNSIGHK